MAKRNKRCECDIRSTQHQPGECKAKSVRQYRRHGRVLLLCCDCVLSIDEEVQVS